MPEAVRNPLPPRQRILGLQLALPVGGPRFESHHYWRRRRSGPCRIRRQSADLRVVVVMLPTSPVEFRSARMKYAFAAQIEMVHARVVMVLESTTHSATKTQRHRGKKGPGELFWALSPLWPAGKCSIYFALHHATLHPACRLLKPHSLSTRDFGALGKTLVSVESKTEEAGSWLKVGPTPGDPCCTLRMPFEGRNSEAFFTRVFTLSAGWRAWRRREATSETLMVGTRNREPSRFAVPVPAAQFPTAAGGACLGRNHRHGSLRRRGAGRL